MAKEKGLRNVVLPRYVVGGLVAYFIVAPLSDEVLTITASSRSMKSTSKNPVAYIDFIRKRSRHEASPLINELIAYEISEWKCLRYSQTSISFHSYVRAKIYQVMVMPSSISFTKAIAIPLT